VVARTLRHSGRWGLTNAAFGDRDLGVVSVGSLGPPDLLVSRVSGAVEVARQLDTEIELETLVELLPEYGPGTVDELAGWLKAQPVGVRVSGQQVLAKEALDRPVDHTRRQRAEQYCRAAEGLFRTDLRATRPWLRFLGVTGSTAYGNPRAGDDCDLMAVVRPGAVWVFMAYTFLRLRLRRARRDGDDDPVWCFNYTLDEVAAIEEYARPRGFLFAREALVARPVAGEAYYRGLLRRADWLRYEAPRLLLRWETTPPNPPVDPEPGTGVVQLLNVLLFPMVAAYLQLKSLWVNRRLRRSGRSEQCFRTITRLDRMTLSTQKFERLAGRMAPASRLSPE
jgi:hypothetical protein